MGLRVDPDALFDVQIKRIHEYKRQLLNLLETIALYARSAQNPTEIGYRASKFSPARRQPSYTRQN